MQQEAVVLVHGIWMKGLEMSLLRRRLHRCGYHCEQFIYQSLFRSPRDNARRLDRFVQQIDYPVIHFVAHSLGGIVLSHMFELFPGQKPGKVVMLGTPLQGSAVARFVYNKPRLRWLLGRSRERGLLGDAPVWRGDRTLGMIAGSHGIGMGKLLMPGGLKAPNDGTVQIDETRAEGVSQYLLVPYSHFGMLFSRNVARQICHFLDKGEFLPG